jgi:cytochrome c peroxidase
MATAATLGPVPPPLSPAAHAGRLAFNDKGLSASGKLSCASCHDPNHAFAPPSARAVQIGGVHDNVAGARATPSIAYAKFTPKFHYDEKGEPAGGFDRDGRADTLAAQAAGPLTSPKEMANTVTAVAARLRTDPYTDEMKAAFGPNVFATDESAFAALGKALEAFQRESADLAPFSSKYDDYLAGRAKLSAAEARGLKLFNDPQKGNCAACHPSARLADGTPPLFTDYTYDSVGVPRNRAIPYTRDRTYFDLGLCGPDRTDLSAKREYCGQFKVPTLRNVATRKVFFHNGEIKSLTDAVRFYATRDTNPKKWYGTHDKFDDLPKDLRKNVNTDEVPYDRKRGEKPRLDESEIADIVAFLKTLTDDPHPR